MKHHLTTLARLAFWHAAWRLALRRPDTSRRMLVALWRRERMAAADFLQTWRLPYAGKIGPDGREQR